MAENANLTPKDDGVGGTEETLTPETTSEGQEEKETPQETTPEGQEPKPEGGEEDTFKKRYADSSREAQRLTQENKLLKAQAAEQANKPNPVAEAPSDSELSETIPDWDLLSPVEQKLQKEQIFLKRKIEALESNYAKSSEQLQWEKDFNEMTVKPEFSALRNKKQEFELFCSKNPHTSQEILAKSFLFEEAKDLGAKEEKEKLNRKGLEKGVGGTRTPTPTGISDEEAAKIMKERPLEYARLVKKGVIK